MYVSAKHLLWVVLVVALIGRGEVARSQGNANGRAMVPEDLLTLQTLKETALSPDGTWAAVVVERPGKPGESYERGYLGGLERSDIWLVSTGGKKLVNVTRGEAVHAGYWNPVWAPDGKRLAMLSTRGSDNVRAYVYDLNTQHLRACSDNGVDLGMRIETAESNTWTVAWLGPNRLLLGLLPIAARPLPMDEMERTLRVSAKALEDVKHGRGVTASILDTEGVERSATQKNVTLSLLDLVSNKTRTVTRIPLIETRLSQRVVSISPDSSYAAILSTDYPQTISRDRPPTTEDIGLLRLGVASLSKTDEAPAWVRNVRPSTFSLAVAPTSVRWSPSGAAFAFIGTSVGDGVPVAFTVHPGEKKPEAVAASHRDASNQEILTAEDIQWSSTGEFLVYGYAGTSSSVKAEASLKDVRGFGRDNNQETARRDWWLISSSSSYHNLTRDLPQAPRMLFRIRNSNLMFTASSGRVWSIDTSSRTTKAVSVLEPGSVSILWPRLADAYRPVEHLIVSRSSPDGADLLRFDANGAAVNFATIPQGARFSDYSPSRQQLAYQTEVTELRLVVNQKDPITLISLNRQLDAIAKPQYRTIQYQTAEGKQLSGAVLLPYGYTPGRRYPLIVSVYGGSVPPSGNWASAYKPHAARIYPDPLILSGHGYAVLIPSIPLSPMGAQSDPMLDLDKGVKPAVDKVIEIGLADPDRIGLVGHSFGGYTVYGLVTQTGRFKAAVAMSGYTDLLSQFGRLDPRYRFTDVPNPLWAPFIVEGQQPRMGVPPWRDLDRYVRNSPYLHADKVTTPLLMIHGDLDSLPLSEAEQFFVALNRMGKRAKLVRYLGEGHSFESPGNVLDMYGHILNWFDEFLLNRQPNQSAQTK